MALIGLYALSASPKLSGMIVCRAQLSPLAEQARPSHWQIQRSFGGGKTGHFLSLRGGGHGSQTPPAFASGPSRFTLTPGDNIAMLFAG